MGLEGIVYRVQLGFLCIPSFSAETGRSPLRNRAFSLLYLKIIFTPWLILSCICLGDANIQSMGDPPDAPSLPWRISSSIVIGISGFLTRSFYMGLNSVEVHGLDRFLELLDKRKDIDGRERGLLTGKPIPQVPGTARMLNGCLCSLESHMRVRTYPTHDI